MTATREQHRAASRLHADNERTPARRDGRDKSQLWEDDDEEMLVEVLEMKMMMTCGLDSNSVGVM